MIDIIKRNNSEYTYSAKDDLGNLILSFELKKTEDMWEVYNAIDYVTDINTLAATAELLFIDIMRLLGGNELLISNDVLKSKRLIFNELFSEDFLEEKGLFKGPGSWRYMSGPPIHETLDASARGYPLPQLLAPVFAPLENTAPDRVIINRDKCTTLRRYSKTKAVMIFEQTYKFRRMLNDLISEKKIASASNKDSPTTKTRVNNALLQKENDLIREISGMQQKMQKILASAYLVPLSNIIDLDYNEEGFNRNVSSLSAEVNAAIKFSIAAKRELSIVNQIIDFRKNQWDLEEKTEKTIEVTTAKKDLIEAQNKLTERKEQFISINEKLSAAEEQIAAKEKELAEAKGKLLQREQEISSANKKIFAKTGKQATVSEQVDDLISNLSEAQRKIETTEMALTVEKNSSKNFHALSNKITSLHATNAENAKADAEVMAQEIKNTKEELTKVVNANDEQQALLKEKLEALQSLRKEAFLIRATGVYLRNMKRIDTYGGELEIKAIADVIQWDLRIWSNNAGVLTSRRVPAGTLEESQLGHALNILESRSEDGIHMVYKPMRPVFSHEGLQLDGSVIDIPDDASCLFGACHRAFQIAMHGEGAQPENNDHLYIAAHAFRLRVCEYLSRNDAPIRKKFNVLIDNMNALFPPTEVVIYDEGGEYFSAADSKKLTALKEKAELEAILNSGRVYKTVSDELSTIYKSERFIENICKVIGQHYPEISDAGIRNLSKTESISSYKSLEDMDDYAILGEDRFSLDIIENDKEILSFFVGNAKAGDSASGNERFSISAAERYVNDLKTDEGVDARTVGGPIELQAIADIYNCQIYLKAFTGSTVFGAHQYSSSFIPAKSSKDPIKYINLALINAGTPDATFIRLNTTGEQEDTEIGSGNVYLACMDATDETVQTEIIDKVSLYLQKIVKATKYDPRKKNKVNDRINHYFYDYIYMGYKGPGQGELKEFDLIPKIPCVVDAFGLRDARKTCFKLANAILHEMGDEIASEMNSAAIIEHSSGNKDLSFHNSVNNRCFGRPLSSLPSLAKSSSMALEATSFGISVANAVVGENLTSVTPEIYNTLQSFSLLGGFFGSLIYCLNNYREERKRAADVQVFQTNLILNLPIDKISEIFTYDENDVKTLWPHKTNESFDRGLLSDSWQRHTCSKLSFTIRSTGESFSITKEKHTPNANGPRESITNLVERAQASESIRKNYAVPAVLMTMLAVNVVLAGFTFANIASQVTNATGAVPDNETEPTEAPTQLSVTSPITANVTIATSFLASLIMVADSYRATRRMRENELSEALNAIMKSYANNKGQLSKELSAQLQRFGVNGLLSNELITVPQMSNIQRSLFKAKQELNEYIVALDKEIEESKSYRDITHETMLLNDLKNIDALVDTANLENLHASSDALNQVTTAVLDVVSTPPQSSGRMSLNNALRRVSVTLQFSAASVRDVQPKEKGKRSSLPRFKMW